MAATGLLGINPYQKGVAIDIASKPINLAIQLEQKERAKQEALDKYFMDYEKSLNPAGMRQQDQDVFLSKLAQAKQYYLQNRDKILNPAKYGAEFQSTYNAGLREAQSLIGQSKQAYGEDKAFKTYVDQLHKSGKALDENKVFDMLNRSKKAIGMGYEAPDSTIIESWTPHNPLALLSKINTLKRTEGAAVPSFLEGSKVKYQDVSPLTIDQGQLRTLANGELQDTGYRKYIEYIASQPTEVERLNKISPLPDKNSPNFLSELSYANILSQAPKEEKRSDVKLTTQEQIRIALAKQKQNSEGQFAPVRNLLDDVASIKNLSNKSVNISKGIVLGKDNKPYTGDVPIDGANIPASIFTVLENYKIKIYPKDRFKLIVKDGRVQGLQTKTGQLIDRGTIEAAQRKYDTERKGEPGLYQGTLEEVSDEPIDLNKFLKRK
jgi:hypothetical protein